MRLETLEKDAKESGGRQPHAAETVPAATTPARAELPAALPGSVLAPSLAPSAAPLAVDRMCQAEIPPVGSIPAAPQLLPGISGPPGALPQAMQPPHLGAPVSLSHSASSGQSALLGQLAPAQPLQLPSSSAQPPRQRVPASLIHSASI